MAHESRKPKRAFRKRTKGGKRRTAKTRRSSKRRGTRRRRQRGGTWGQEHKDDKEWLKGHILDGGAACASLEGADCKDYLYRDGNKFYYCRDAGNGQCAAVGKGMLGVARQKKQATSEDTARATWARMPEQTPSPAAAEPLASSARPGDPKFVPKPSASVPAASKSGASGSGASVSGASRSGGVSGGGGGGVSGGGGGAGAAAGVQSGPPAPSSREGMQVATDYLHKMIASATSDPALHLRMREAYVKAGRGNFVQAQHILESTERGGDTSPGPTASAEEVRPAASAPKTPSQSSEPPSVHQDPPTPGAGLSDRPSKHSAFEPDSERMASFSGAAAIMGGDESGFGGAERAAHQDRVPVGSGGTPVPPTGKSPEQKQQEAEEMRLALEKQEEAVRLGGADPLPKRVHMKPPAPLDAPPVREGGRRTRRKSKRKRKRRTRSRTRKR